MGNKDIERKAMQVTEGIRVADFKQYCAGLAAVQDIRAASGVVFSEAEWCSEC